MPETKQSIYVIRPTRVLMLREGRTADETEALVKHFEYLEGLAENGVVLLAGRTQENDESTFGIVIVEADSEEAARAVMENDPAVVGGVMQPRLHPFSIAVRGIGQKPG